MLGWAWLAFLTTPSFSQTPTGRETEAQRLAREYVDYFVRLSEAQHRGTLGATGPSGSATAAQDFRSHPPFETLDTNDQRLVADMFLANLRELLEKRVASSLADMQKRREVLVKYWVEIRGQRNQAEINKAELLANKAVAGKLASLISLDNRWFWLATVIVVAVLAAISWHDRRHEYRRHLMGAKARAMGVARWLRYLLIALVALTALVFFAGNQIFEWLVHAGGGADTPTAADLEAQVKGLEARVKELKATAPPAEPSRSSSEDPEVRLLDYWKLAQHQIREAQVAVAVQRELQAELNKDLEQLKQLEAEAAQNASDIAAFHRSKRWIRAGMGAGMLMLVSASSVMMFRGMRRRRTLTENTCPMCMAIGKLEDVPESSGQSVRCSNVISESPFEECHFTFNTLYRDMTKLCFPTLGHPGSGKTHWLAMTYRELNQGNYPELVQFDKVRGESSEEMDRIVDDLINARLSTMATQVDRLPRPLLFNFRDHDRYGHSSLMVSIFDYSGEVLQRMTLNDPQRRRALDADGYLFFLDPTQRSEEQVKELIDFREDVRVLRKVKSGQALRAPVALCVSKIDLLINQDYADPGGGGPIGRFYKELEEIDPSGAGLTLEVIERRSEAMRRLRDTIWPGWQVEKQIHELFGGRCMFFPLTPVGLTELGVDELGQRTIQPYGILDPLMWLLHMNGYRVLE
ncbi:MAG: hypothetical protein U0935_16565 [Pirellulales bacterium]